MKFITFVSTGEHGASLAQADRKQETLEAKS
jgi:hypothetical protein